MINRSIVIIHPKEPFFQWLRSIPDSCELTLEQYEDDSTAYLIPDYDDDVHKEQVLAQFFSLIFEDILSGWSNVPKDWPKNRTLETFNLWFSCDFHSLVLDLVADPLVREE